MVGTARCAVRGRRSAASLPRARDQKWLEDIARYWVRTCDLSPRRRLVLKWWVT